MNGERVLRSLGFEPAHTVITRRRFLRAGTGLAAGLAGIDLLAANATAQTTSATPSVPEQIRLTDQLIKAAQAEGTLTVRHSTPVGTQQAFADAFTKQFGISVQIDRKVGVVGNQAFAQEERAGKHVIDVNDSSDPPGLKKLAEEGLYLRYALPDVDPKLDKGFSVPSLGYAYNIDKIVIQYNPERISTPEAVSLFKTWRGLLDPRLSDGKIGMTEPGGGATPFGTYLMFYQLPQYGRDFLVKLAAQKPRLYPGSAPGREDLASGATTVFIPNWEQIGMELFLKGDRTRWTYPEIAPTFPNDLLAINTRAPHPSAARLWVAWLMSRDGAKAVMDTGSVSTVPGVSDDRPAILRLKQTDWWKPFPDSIGWVPDRTYWDNNYGALMPDMRQVLGWRG